MNEEDDEKGARFSEGEEGDDVEDVEDFANCTLRLFLIGYLLQLTACAVVMANDFDDTAFDIGGKPAATKEEKKPVKTAPKASTAKKASGGTKKGPATTKKGQHLEIEYDEPEREKVKLRR